jgi:hypothetical protein
VSERFFKSRNIHTHNENFNPISTSPSNESIVAAATVDEQNCELNDSIFTAQSSNWKRKMGRRGEKINVLITASNTQKNNTKSDE